MVGSKEGRVVKTKTAYQTYRGGCVKPPPHWDELPQWAREALEGTMHVASLMRRAGGARTPSDSGENDSDSEPNEPDQT